MKTGLCRTRNLMQDEFDSEAPEKGLLPRTVWLYGQGKLETKWVQKSKDAKRLSIGRDWKKYRLALLNQD